MVVRPIGKHKREYVKDPFTHEDGSKVCLT